MGEAGGQQQFLQVTVINLTWGPRCYSCPEPPNQCPYQPTIAMARAYRKPSTPPSDPALSWEEGRVGAGVQGHLTVSIETVQASGMPESQVASVSLLPQAWGTSFPARPEKALEKPWKSAVTVRDE